MKVFSFILLGVLIYGGVFGTTFTPASGKFRLLSARTTFTEKEKLGFLDGLHNGFAMPGAVVGNYCKWMIGLVSDLWGGDDAQTAEPVGLIGSLIVGTIGLVLFVGGCLLGAVMGFFIHLLFYFALFIKLLFVAATPGYHAGLLVGATATWLLFAAVSVTSERAPTESDAA